MNRPSGSDAVDRFLEDLGSAPVPVGLEHRVLQHVRARQSGRGRSFRFLVLAAACALIAATVTIVAVGSGLVESPSHIVAPSLVAPTSAATGTPVFAASPSAGPRDASGFEMTITNAEWGDVQVEVTDASGQVTSAQVAAPEQMPSGLLNANPIVAAVPGGDGHGVVVAWVGGACEMRVALSIAADASSIELARTNAPSCDDVGLARAIVLWFSDAVDPGTMHVTATDETLTEQNLNPGTVAAAPDGTIWVGGRVPTGDAVVVYRPGGTGSDGPWWFVRVGFGIVNGMSAPDKTNVFAAVGCVMGSSGCTPGLYLSTDHARFTRVFGEDYLHVSFGGSLGVAVDAITPMGSTTRLEVTSDGGTTWSERVTPCPAGSNAQSASAIAPARLVVLCSSAASDAAILELSSDLGASWTGQALDGIPSGDPATGISFTGPSAGWAWTSSGALYATRDGGATWTPLPFGPSYDKWVVSGALVAGGYQPDQSAAPSSGYLLLREPRRGVTALVETGDGGLTWTEVHTFAIP